MVDPYPLLQQYFWERTQLDQKTFDRIKTAFTPQKVARKTILVAYGEVCRSFYFVNQGCLRLYTISNEGEESTRYFAFEGQFGTALTSLITQQPATEIVETLESAVLLVISREKFFDLVEKCPPMGKVYRLILESAYITAQQRIYSLQRDEALERLRALLDRHPAILQRLPSRVVATYLGISPYTLSRLKAALFPSLGK